MSAMHNLAAVLTLAAATAVAQNSISRPFPTSSSLGQTLHGLLVDPRISHSHWGIAVTALDGTPLFGLDEARLFRPASTAKLFTTVAAMERLRPSSTVTTTVSPSVRFTGDTLNGDLLLYGNGDANLNGLHFPYEPKGQSDGTQNDPLAAVDDLATQVAAKGLRHITGSIYAYDRGPWQPYSQGWNQDDLLWGYAAPVSFLAINDNQIDVRVTPGAKEGEPVIATLSPDLGELELKNEARTTGAKSKSELGWEREPDSRVVRLFGTLALDAPPDTEHLAVTDPVQFAADALRARLIAHGITVDGPAESRHLPFEETRGFLAQSREPMPKNPDGSGASGDCIGGCPAVLASHTSPTLIEDIVFTLKTSQNLHAELMLRRMGMDISTAAGGFTAQDWLAQGARAVRDSVLHAGIDPDDFVFYDGSGLSDKDLVTPRAEVQLLAYAARQSWFSAWKAALPVGGVDGTLAHRFQQAPLRGHVFAKTGTLGETNALAGYVETRSGRTVVVSILADNHVPGSHAERETIDKIVAAIAANE